MSLLFTAFLVAAPAWAAQQPSSSGADQKPRTDDKQPAATDRESTTDRFDLPVSLDKIKEGLAQPKPPLSLTTTDVKPTFRVQILERQKIEELLATLNFKTTPAPAGGLYWNEVQRQMWPSVDNPMRQPYAAFNQGELLTILIENLVGKYLAGKAVNAVTSAERAHAESAARDEVRQAIRDYCAAQPNSGAGIQICESSGAIR
jgi:hypothetical protein